MLLKRLSFYFVIGLSAFKASAELCTTNLLVDDFSHFANRKNNLKLKASDDHSMPTISASGGTLSFVPGNGSYFYETLPCLDAPGVGYGALAFSIKGPRNASITLEIQTTRNCSAEIYDSVWRYVVDFDGELQRVTAPLDTFKDADTHGIAGFNWATWQSDDPAFVWQMRDVEMLCGLDI